MGAAGPPATGAPRRGTRLVALVALALAAAPAAAAPPDDAAAVRALRAGDVYATPALGGLTGPVRERLAVKAEQLRARGEEVKLAVVGPLRGDDPYLYAEDLRDRLGYGGTLVVTTPDGPVGAAGERRPDSLRGAFAAARVDDLQGPAQRLIAASELALPPDAEGSSWREVVVLIGLTLLGGAWAISWGMRREQRRARGRLVESRAMLRVGVDALRARAALVDARGDLPREARDALDRARGRADRARARGDTTDDGGQVDAALREVHDGLRDVERAGRAVGLRLPADAPLEGLCSVDPGHGAAEATAPVDGCGEAPVCAACAARAAEGRALTPRMVPVDGRPVPAATAGVARPPEPEGD